MVVFFLKKMSVINLQILLLGDSSVGKTSLLMRYINNEFKESMISTIGMDIHKKQIKISNKEVLLHLVDITGQERFKSVARTYYKDVDGIIFIFDVTNKDSFIHIKDWLKDAQTYEVDFDYIIVGNKIDLNDIIEVNEENVKSTYKKAEYIKTSSKNGTNINEAFEEITKIILKRLERTGSISRIDSRSSFHLDNNQIIEHNSHSKCCKK